MNLLLWRHAEAEDGFPDDTRRLTPRGEKQARKVADWINTHAPKDLHILVSPAVRCQQTAKALNRSFVTDERLSTRSHSAGLLAACGWLDRESAQSLQNTSVLIVGHQPTLGQTIAFLMSGTEDYWSVKKSSVWWLSGKVRDNGVRIGLKSVITPDCL